MSTLNQILIILGVLLLIALAGRIVVRAHDVPDEPDDGEDVNFLDRFDRWDR